MKRQHGAALVEFALIALLFFILLLGIIEFGRLWFTYNTLVEATRRGARIAAVCPVNQQGIDQVRQATMFNNSPDGDASGETGFLGLTEDNISVNYFDADMNIVNTPVTSITDDAYSHITFVRVSITNFEHTLFIPTFFSIFNAPPVTTTLPSESLGRTTNQNPITERCCYGVCSTVT